MNMSDIYTDNRPKIIGQVGNPDEGKSNVLYWTIKELQKNYNFSLYSYGLRMDMGERKIYSIEELERIENSIIFLDEFASLFRLENRKMWTSVEKTLRLIFHNNNMIVLSGLPENYHKFISGKLDVIMYKRCNRSDFINNSRVKVVAESYSGVELGMAVLNIKKEEVLVFDGKHYHKLNVPYVESHDTKKHNQPILNQK